MRVNLTFRSRADALRARLNRDVRHHMSLPLRDALVPKLRAAFSSELMRVGGQDRAPKFKQSNLPPKSLSTCVSSLLTKSSSTATVVAVGPGLVAKRSVGYSRNFSSVNEATYGPVPSSGDA